MSGRESASEELRDELLERVRVHPRILKLLERSIDGVWYQDLEQPERLWLSGRVKIVLGHTPRSIHDDAAWWRQVVHPDDVATIDEATRAHLARPDRPIDHLVRCRHADGSLVWMRRRGVVLDDDSGPARLVGTFTDVSVGHDRDRAYREEIEAATFSLAQLARRNDEVREVAASLESKVRHAAAEMERQRVELASAHRRLKEQAERLDRSNRELTSVGFVVSHDFRTPMVRVAGFLRLLEGRVAEELDHESRSWLAQAITGVGELQDLANEFLRITRVDSRGAGFRPVDLDEVVAHTVRRLRDPIEDANVDVAWRSLPEVVGDGEQLVQVMAELFENAIRFRARRSPRILVSATADDEKHVVSVRDNGIGIDEGQQDRIFDLFRQGEDVPLEGFGTGLALVRRIVHRHGGQVWLAESSRSGSTFRFSLPRRPSVRASERAASDAVPPTP